MQAGTMKDVFEKPGKIFWRFLALHFIEEFVEVFRGLAFAT